MGEAMMLVGILKTHGPIGVIVVGAVVGIVALVRNWMKTAREERVEKDSERSDLFRALTNQNTQTLVILRDELRMAQESNHRYFEMMSRNTSALEKLVSQAEERAHDMREIRSDIGNINSTLEHMDGAIVSMSHSK